MPIPQPNPIMVFHEPITHTALAGGKVYTYEPGTTTDKTTWKDAAKATAHANPIILDAYGRPPTTGMIFWEGLYDVKVTDSADVEVDTISSFGDPYSAVATDLNNLIQNQSFETDADSDSIPDNWTMTTAGTSTLTRITTDHNHGLACLQITSATSGGSYASSAFFEASPSTEYEGAFDLKSDSATNDITVQIEWFDNTQSTLSTSNIYNKATGNPTSWTRYTGLSVTSPASTKFGKLHIINNGTTGQLKMDNVVFRAADASLSPMYPRGLLLSNNASDASHDIDISIGECRDSANTVNMVLSTAITKQIDAAWAVGTDAGGTFSGTTIAANSIYYVWLIKNITAGIVDAGFDASASAPTLPTGYTKSRLIGYVLTDASALIRAFIHSGDYFRIKDPFNDVNDSTITSDAFETATISCPPLCLAHLYGRSYNTTAQDLTGVTIRTAGASDTGPASDGSESLLVGAEAPTSEYAVHGSDGLDLEGGVCRRGVGRDAGRFHQECRLHHADPEYAPMNGWWVDPLTGIPLAYKNDKSPPKSRPDAVFVTTPMPEEKDPFFPDNNPYKFVGNAWTVDASEAARRAQARQQKADKLARQEAAKARLEAGQGNPNPTRQDISDLLELLS